MSGHEAHDRSAIPPSTREWIIALAWVVGSAALAIAVIVLVAMTFVVACGCTTP